MEEKALDEKWPGPLCKELGLSSQFISRCVENEELHKLERPGANVSNALVLELRNVCQSLSVAANVVIAVSGCECVENTVKSVGNRISRLKMKRARLLKDKASNLVCDLLSETFVCSVPVSITPNAITQKEINTSTRERESVSSADSAFELTSIECMSEEIVCLESRLGAEVCAREKMKECLASFKLKLKALRMKSARRNAKLQQVSEHESELEILVDGLNLELGQAKERQQRAEKKVVNERHQKYRQQRKSQSLAESLDGVSESFRSATSDTRSYENDLLLRISELENEVTYLQDRADECSVFQTKHCSGQYKDGVRQCCYELLGKNVGVWNVASVIRSVALMLEISVVDLPSVGSLSKMLLELKAASFLQIAEAIDSGDSCNTLHSDGTSKFGKKYNSYQIATSSQMFSIGLVDMYCGSAQHAFDKFQEVLPDVELV